MGRIAKPSGGGLTKYYWYPGEKTDWIRAALALGSGLLMFTAVGMTTQSGLAAAVLGTSMAAGVAGLSFGRRDIRALHTCTRFAPADTGRALWRALVKGFGAAGAAVIVLNMGERGFWADWVLPVVPAIVGALAHQAGMMAERVSQAEEPVKASESAAAARVTVPAPRSAPADLRPVSGSERAGPHVAVAATTGPVRA